MSAVLATPLADDALRPRGRSRANAVGELWRLARADVFERMRQHGFLVSMLVMTWLAHGMMPAASAGYRTFVVNSLYRPEYGAAWVGLLTATLTSIYLLFVGFYLVKGSVERDRRTGVGQILAAARVRGTRYLFAKALSNLTVLLAMSAVVFVMALVMQQVLGEDRRFDLLATLAPFAFVVLPTAAFVAAMAVFFDCVSFLRGGLGNIAWFFLLGFILASSGIDTDHASPFRDVTGGVAVSEVALGALQRTHPEVVTSHHDMSMGVNVDPRWKNHPVRTYPLGPVPFSPRAAGSRLLWIAIAAAIVVAAGRVFDRFDRAAAPLLARKEAAAPSATLARIPAAPMAAPMRRASELTVAPRGAGFAALLHAELLLLLKGRSWWWYAGLFGAVVAETFAPLRAAREYILPIATLWPVLVWSALGHRERRDNVAPVLFSSPRPLGRLLAASWSAGTAVALLLAAPVLVRLALAGEGAMLLSGVVGACTIASLALACGVWTGSAKMFEALFLMLWYVGPMHQIAFVDYTGVTVERPLAMTTTHAGVALALVALAFWGRARRLQN